MTSTVLIIGKGAREHVLSCMYEQSSLFDRIVVAPGNDFMLFDRHKEVLLADCSLTDPSSVLHLAECYNPTLIDVAQDDALASGVTDVLRDHGYLVFGPSQSAARLEWDKIWSREQMKSSSISIPVFSSFEFIEHGIAYAREHFSSCSTPLFVKAAGLCGGKGALKVDNLDEAVSAMTHLRSFGEAGRRFVIEESLFGEEFSLYLIGGAATYSTFLLAQDHKRLLNYDTGPQTGGMGAVSPLSLSIDEEDTAEILALPVLRDLVEQDNPYSGILYIGGIFGDEVGVIEYNARWGDPEAQVVLPGLLQDYGILALSVASGDFSGSSLSLSKKTRVCVVGAVKGYPTDYRSAIGKRVFGLEQAAALPFVQIYGAGLASDGEHYYVNGGRLFSVVGEGDTIIEARAAAYHAMSLISVEDNNLHYRTDIGWRDVARYMSE